MDSKNVLSVDQQRVKSLLKTTSKARNAFDMLHCSKSFMAGSQLLLNFISSRISSCQGKGDFSDEVKYVLKRLISGLSASKESVRDGCYITLYAVLVQHPECLSFITSYIDTFFLENKDEKGSEYKIGRIMAFGAIIRSGCVSKDFPKAESITKTILSMSGKKLSTDIIVCQFLVHHLILCKGVNLSSTIWREIGKDLQEDVRTLRPSMLLLRLVFSRSEFSNVLPGVDANFRRETFLDDSLKFYVSTLKDLSEKNVDISHFTNDLMKALSSVDEENIVPGIENFFLRVIHPLFGKFSPKFVTFMLIIVQEALPYVTTAEEVERVLSVKFLKMLIKFQKLNLPQSNSSIQSFSSVVLGQVIKLQNDNSDVQYAFVKQLVSTSHGLQFDVVCGTSLLQQMAQHLSTKNIKKFATLLKDILREESQVSTEEEGNLSDNALSAIELLSRVVCHPKITSDICYVEWQARQITHVMQFTFFKPHSNKIQLHLVKTYLRTVNHMPKLIQHQIKLIAAILNKIKMIVESCTEPCPFSKEAKDCFKNCVARMVQLSESETSHRLNRFNLLYQLLFGHVALSLFVNSDDAIALRDKTDHCYGVYARESFNGESESKCEKIMVDLLLFVLSKEENYWRKVAVSLFRHMCSSMSPSSLLIITDVIYPKEVEASNWNLDLETANHDGVKGKKYDTSNPELCREEDYSDDEGDSEEEGSSSEKLEGDSEEEESDSEEVESDSVEVEEVSEGEESDLSDDGEESLTESQKAEILKLKMQMQTLIGVPSEDDIPIDSVSEEDLLNLDRHLGALVGQVASIRGLSVKDKRRMKMEEIKEATNSTHYKLRVCDLLSCVVSEPPSMAHLVLILRPIFLALGEASKSKDKEQKPLVHRLRCILMDINKVKKFPPTQENISFNNLANEFEELSKLSRMVSRSNLRKEYGWCWTFLLQCAIHLSLEGPNALSSLEKFFQDYAHLIEISYKKDECIVDGPLHLDSEHLNLVLDKLLMLVFSKASKQRQFCMNMILTVLNNEPAMSKMSEAFVCDFHARLSSSIIELYECAKTEGKFQASFLVAVNTFLKTLRKLHRTKTQWESWFNWAGVISSLKNFNQDNSPRYFKALTSSITGVLNVINSDFVSKVAKV